MCLFIHQPFLSRALAHPDGNAGFWVAQTNDGAAERLIRRWWDVSDPPAARAWPFEQNAVGALRRAHDGKHATVCIPYPEFFGYGPYSYVHHPVDKPASQPGFRLALSNLGLTQDMFFAEIQELLASSVHTLEIEATQNEMAARSSADPQFYKTCEVQCKDLDLV